LIISRSVNPKSSIVGVVVTTYRSHRNRRISTLSRAFGSSSRYQKHHIYFCLILSLVCLRSSYNYSYSAVFTIYHWQSQNLNLNLVFSNYTAAPASETEYDICWSTQILFNLGMPIDSLRAT